MAHLFRSSVLLLLVAVPAADPILWAVAVTRRIAPDAKSSNRIWSARRGEARLGAARGESEGFHLVVTAEGGGLTDLELTATELAGAAGTIGRERIHLYREAFFEIDEISDVEGHPRLGETGTVPDALIPFVDPYGSGQEISIPFDVPAASSQPLWVLVEVPRGAAAGSYEATLTLVRRTGGAILGRRAPTSTSRRGSSIRGCGTTSPPADGSSIAPSSSSKWTTGASSATNPSPRGKLMSDLPGAPSP